MLAYPIVIVLCAAVLTIYTKLKHKPYRVPKALVAGYNIIAYSLVLIEHVLVIPFFTLVFRIFIAKSNDTNIAEEAVSSGFEKAWSVGHIIYCTFTVISAACFCFIIAVSWLFFFLTHYQSPLPWSDETILTRITLFVIQVTLSAFLVFDRKVICFESQ